MRRVICGTCALSVMAALGCTEGEDVLLGRAQRTPDDASSSESDRDAGAPSTPPEEDAQEVRRCDAESEGELELLVDIDHVEEPSCTGACSIQPHFVRAASDGSAWVSAGVSETGEPEQLWLGHYDVGGELLGSALVDNANTWGHLALDDRGNAWLLTGELEGGYSRLHRFDAAVHEIRAQVMADSYSDMVAYPGVGMLLSGGSQPRIVTAVNYDGDQLWSRTDSTRGAGRIAVDGEGHIVVTSLVPWLVDWLGDQPLGTLAGTYKPLIRPDSTPPVTFLAVGGRLTLVANEPFFGGGMFTPQTNVEQVDREFGTRWRWQVAARLDAAATFDSATGSTLVAALEVDARQSEPPSAPGLGLVAISQDGRSCRRFTVQGPHMFGAIDSGPTGEIWFAGLRVIPGGIGPRIGRWARPDL